MICDSFQPIRFRSQQINFDQLFFMAKPNHNRGTPIIRQQDRFTVGYLGYGRVLGAGVEFHFPIKKNNKKIKNIFSQVCIREKSISAHFLSFRTHFTFSWLPMSPPWVHCGLMGRQEKVKCVRNDNKCTEMIFSLMQTCENMFFYYFIIFFNRKVKFDASTQHPTVT